MKYSNIDLEKICAASQPDWHHSASRFALRKSQKLPLCGTTIRRLALAVVTLMVCHCGTEKFTGSSRTQPTVKASQDQIAAGNVNQNAGSTGSNIGNEASGAGNVGIGTGNLAASSGPDSGMQVGNQSQSSGGQTFTGSSGTPWKADTVITDFGTLEKCKMDALVATGDLSLCLKCFEQWLGNSGKITASACGCFRSPGDIPRKS